MTNLWQICRKRLLATEGEGMRQTMRIETMPNIYKWEVRFVLKILSLVISLQEFFRARFPCQVISELGFCL